MRQAKTWVISDTHFNHAGIVEGGFRPADHGERTLKALQQLVQPADTLIHLGDVIFSRTSELKAMLDTVAGRKLLVRGNHDRKLRWYQRNGFDAAVDALVIDRILFTHKPQRDLPDWIDINIHGHLHQNTHRTEEVEGVWWDNGGRHRLFTLEGLFAPVELNDFLARTKSHEPARWWDTSNAATKS